MTATSFYTDGAAYEEAIAKAVDTVPASGGNNAAPSSMYPNGDVYDYLSEESVFAAQMEALRAACAARETAAAASASGAASSASAAATSESNAAASASAASGSASAAAGSASSASTSAGTATTQAGIATTQAGIATTKAGEASTSAGNAATSASTATTQAGIATTKAGEASTSASNAAASASAAATSETNAATSKTNAAASAAAAATSEANIGTAIQAAAANDAPPMDGVAAVGVATQWAREDHVHPTDTSRASVSYVDTQDAALTSAINLKAPLASPAFTGTVTVPNQSAGDNSTKAANTAYVDAAVAAGGGGAGKIPRGHIAGLTLSTAGSSTTFSVAAGQAVDSTHASAMALAASISKTTGGFAAGTGNGSLDTGSIAASTWYHVWLISTAGGTVDVLTSLSASAPTMPGSYTLKRRIGSMKTNGSSQWTKFIQNGDLFMWARPVLDVVVANPGTAAVTRTLTAPTGVKTEALIHVMGSCASGSTDSPGAIYISDLDQDDVVAATSGASSVSLYVGVAATFQLGTDTLVMTNTSAQVRTRLQTSTAGATIYINTKGWRDTRGRNA